MIWCSDYFDEKQLKTGHWGGNLTEQAIEESTLKDAIRASIRSHCKLHGVLDPFDRAYALQMAIDTQDLYPPVKRFLVATLAGKPVNPFDRLYLVTLGRETLDQFGPVARFCQSLSESDPPTVGHLEKD